MIVRAFLPLAVVVVVSAGPAIFGVSPETAPGGISSSQKYQRPSGLPPPLTAPGGISSSQRPQRPSRLPPPLTAPGGISSSQRPQRPSGLPPPLTAPGGISSSQRPQRPSGLPPPLTAPGGISSAQQPPPRPVIPILIDERVGPLQDGSYSFNFETGNGISRQEQGSPQGEAGAVAVQGGWSFTFPDGTHAVLTFVADENGYRPVSDLLPTPHPLPAHAVAQVEFARQQQAQEAAGGGGRRYGS